MKPSIVCMCIVSLNKAIVIYFAGLDSSFGKRGIPIQGSRARPRWWVGRAMISTAIHALHLHRLGKLDLRGFDCLCA